MRLFALLLLACGGSEPCDVGAVPDGGGLYCCDARMQWCLYADDAGMRVVGGP